MHEDSAGHERQLVALAARAGLRDCLKYLSEPVEDSKDGR